MLEEKMLESNIWAVVGANTDPSKYGNMIYRKLRSRGYRVYPVNPLYDMVEGDKCYRSLSELPEEPDVINFVVTPKRSMEYIKEAKRLGIEYLWFQPGASDEKVMKKVEELNLSAVQACALVATG